VHFFLDHGGKGSFPAMVKVVEISMEAPTPVVVVILLFGSCTVAVKLLGANIRHAL
jgi:hypothetical protein